MAKYTKISRYGPGGRNCVCCGPAPRERKKHDRMVKRRERQLCSEEIRDDLEEDNEERDVSR